VSVVPPTELDRLDPAPAPPKRRKGKNEQAVLRDLRALPDDLRQGAIAAVALGLARDLDEGDMTARDKSGMYAQLRMAMVTLADMAPGEVKGDATDEVRARRERRLQASGE
jgi:hypothetical protein